jgi:putative tryptophan/tyrosine transport system substrate-binding protein
VKRRDFITLLGGAAAAWPLAARAQQERMRRIGVLTTLAEADPEPKRWLTAFQVELQKLGWAQGRNISFEYRWPSSDEQRLQSYAAELVKMAPDVIFAASPHWGRCIERAAPCRSCSCRYPTRSSLALLPVLHGQAAT